MPKVSFDIGNGICIGRYQVLRDHYDTCALQKPSSRRAAGQEVSWAQPPSPKQKALRAVLLTSPFVDLWMVDLQLSFRFCPTESMSFLPLPVGSEEFGCGSKPTVPFWGRCTTHFRTYFGGDWDVHWGSNQDFLTHGHFSGASTGFLPRVMGWAKSEVSQTSQSLETCTFSDMTRTPRPTVRRSSNWWGRALGGLEHRVNCWKLNNKHRRHRTPISFLWLGA